MDPADPITAALNVTAATVAVAHTAQWKDIAVTVVFAVLIVFIVYFAVRGLLRRESDRTSRISFDDLLVDPITGMMDPARCMLVGGWAVASLVLIYSVAKGTMSDAMYGLYCACILAPAVAVVLKTKVALPGMPDLPTPTTKTTTTTETTTDPKP